MARPRRAADAAIAPTEAELEVLHVLWTRGPSTVREVHDAIGVAKGIGYTTILKQMQVMQAKGLLVRSERFKSHVYEPSQPQARTQRQIAQGLLHRVFNGSALDLLQSALAGHKVDARELAEIRKLLDETKRKEK
jgi:predicted transcriptional regulator